ncbi:MAG TPA: universal stress protein [Streptosporangiaceae bacterium]|nr:universal stress protein [Streptosporangiaceae bacterium]
MRIIPAQRCVIVGVDGSPNSLAALHRAADEARRRCARLDVIHVADERGGWIFAAARVVAWLRLRRLVAQELPRTQHITTRLRIAYGSPAGVLIRAADRAELLVIGARGDAPHGSLLGGDTVPRVLAASPCEVVVCADQAHRELEA